MDNLTEISQQTSNLNLQQYRNKEQFELQVDNNTYKTQKTIHHQQTCINRYINDGPSIKINPMLTEKEQMQLNIEDNIKRVQLTNGSLIVRCGYVEMDSKSFFNKWQIVYCILTANKLYCYENDLRINLILSINLQLMQCNIKENKEKYTITLFVTEFDDYFSFKIYTESQFKGWFNDLTCTIFYYQQHKKIKFLQGKDSIYCLRDAITQEQFLNIAEDGDLLLMVTNDTKCALQRFVTNSQYDHVSLILKFGNQIKIFQSNANQGVKLYDWNKFISEFHDYKQISFRKLYSTQRQHYKDVLAKFIKSSIGKKYDLNVLKLIKKSSSDSQGYFCSQLVAKVYKKLGLLEQGRSVNSYWPMDFTQRGGLKLLNSACLGQQRLIILNKHLKFTS